MFPQLQFFSGSPQPEWLQFMIKEFIKDGDSFSLSSYQSVARLTDIHPAVQGLIIEVVVENVPLRLAPPKFVRCPKVVTIAEIIIYGEHR